MSIKRYKVECLECHESDILTVDDQLHSVLDYEDKFKTPFISSRWRPDLKWGFQCKCLNDSRLAPQEADDFDKLVRGDKESLKRIAASLLIPDEKQFRMETI